MIQRKTSFLKFPLYRSEPLESAKDWIERKKTFDNIGNLWRIHDKLYDFTDFISMHPGGKEWITSSRGTDITEAFETHHLKKTARKLLPPYFVKRDESPQNKIFTFKNDGFYKTLKSKVIERLSKTPSNIRKKSDRVTDTLFMTVLFLSPLSCLLWTLDPTIGTMLMISNGILLSFLVTCAHSYFHRADNWRMYLFNINGLSFEDWRITHSMSHHIFTNTSHDAEIVFLEPFLQYLPYKDKSLLFKMSVIYWPIIGIILFTSSLVRNLFRSGTKFRWTRTIPLFLPIWMYAVGGQPLLTTVAIWITTCLISSLFFTISALTSGHLNEDNFFEGNNNKEETIDWGLHQLRTIVERSDYISVSDHFKSFTRFGDHVLHHLFPTLDHAEFQYLYPVLLEHCKEYGVELRTTNFYAAMFHQVKQLTSQS